MVTCGYRLRRWNETNYILKYIPDHVFSGGPEESVLSHRVHAFHFYLNLINAGNDSWVEVYVKLYNTPILKDFWAPFSLSDVDVLGELKLNAFVL